MGAKLLTSGENPMVAYSVNAISITGIIVSITKIVKDHEVDFAVIHELNTVNPPKIQGYTYLNAREDNKFRGTAVYVANKWRKHVTKIPENVKEVNMEMIHLRVSTLPTLLILIAFLESSPSVEEAIRAQVRPNIYPF